MDKEKALETALAQLDKQFGKGAVMRLGQSPQMATEALPTGALALHKVAPPLRRAEFDIMFGTGVSRSGGILDLAIELGIADKSGSWFTYGETRIGQGRGNAKSFLTENPPVAAEMEARVRALALDRPVTFSTQMEEESELALAV